jgi:hypothetical protein
MAQSQTVPAATPPQIDWLTLIAISALASVLSVFLHEHLGHTAACILLGSRPTEIGAFYSDCNYAGMSDTSIRLVALAGPVISLLTFGVCLLVMRRLPTHVLVATYVVWLLGSISGMAAAGYLLFSGLSGIGDFGLTRDGLFYRMTPEWLWRVVLTVAGVACYIGIVVIAVRAFDRRLGGAGGAVRIRYARHLALASYLTNVVLGITIGLLNPQGFAIGLIATAASSGAPSGLLWMMQLLDRNKQGATPWLTINRRWEWIVVAGIATVAYTLVFGPSVRP